MLCLDPYYRTRRGFAVLVEREWLDGGHKFAQRVGCLSPDFADKQRSPVFMQFLDLVNMLAGHFPAAFEFNAAFLAEVYATLVEARFGTFLGNNAQERAASGTGAGSLWPGLFAGERTDLVNADYAAQPPLVVGVGEVAVRESLFAGRG